MIKNEIDTAAELAKQLGLPVRRFVLECKDAAGNDFNFEATHIGEISDGDIVDEWVRILAGEGCALDAIYELLGGYSNVELQAMAAMNRSAAMRHVRNLCISSQSAAIDVYP